MRAGARHRLDAEAVDRAPAERDGIHPEDQLLREEFKSKLKENIKKRWAEKEKNKINQKPAEPNKVS